MLMSSLSVIWLISWSTRCATGRLASSHGQEADAAAPRAEPGAAPPGAVPDVPAPVVAPATTAAVIAASATLRRRAPPVILASRPRQFLCAIACITTDSQRQALGKCATLSSLVRTLGPPPAAVKRPR